MAEAYLAKAMVSHKAALIHIATDTRNASLTSILPHGNLAVVSDYGFFVCVHGNHDFVVVNLTLQMLIIEVATGIDERFLLIGLFYQVEEIEQ